MNQERFFASLRMTMRNLGRRGPAEAVPLHRAGSATIPLRKRSFGAAGRVRMTGRSEERSAFDCAQGRLSTLVGMTEKSEKARRGSSTPLRFGRNDRKRKSG